MDKLSRFLDERATNGLLRRLTPQEERHTPAHAVREGCAYVDFCSNDYLGLSAHPALVQAAIDALRRYGVGAGASRLMSGDLRIHHELEEATAAFKGTPRALVFNSGYQANLGLIAALADRHDVIFADQLCHASQLDGALLSRAKLIRYRHNDPGHLAELLAKHRAGFDRALILTETVFSMDGDLAPLAELVAVKEQYDGLLVVDEAHATGVFGPRGRGCVAAAGLTDRVEVIMGTFSKGLGGFGAYVAANATIIDYLINAARSFIYSTALPPAVIAANLAAIRLCQDGLDLGPALLATADRFRAALRAQGWATGGASQIIPLHIGDPHAAVALADRLREHHLLTLPIRPPTVPQGTARLRLSLSAAHTEAHLRQVLEALGHG